MNKLECFVLDKIDVLVDLDIGFKVTLTNILGRLPWMRHTGLCSVIRDAKGGTSENVADKRLMAQVGL